MIDTGRGQKFDSKLNKKKVLIMGEVAPRLR